MNRIQHFLLISPFLLCCSKLFTQSYKTDSFLIENKQRFFHFNEPPKKNKNGSLIFILHGSGGNGTGMIQPALGLEKKSVQENCILVYPDGYKNFWNECRKASTAIANIENINEQVFFDSMIHYFKSKYTIQEEKIFAIGFSGGAQMAFKLALTMPGKFKAITTVVANLPTTENMDCTPMRVPVNVMMVNGTADGVCPFDGGEMKAQNITLGNVKSTMETFQYWARLSNYTRKPKKIKLFDKDPTDSISIEKYSFSGKKTAVVLYKIINGKHEFPKDFDLFIQAWEFFKK